MRAVAGIDDVRVEEAREKMGCAGSLVANDNDIRIERLEIARSVLEAFAFLKGRGIGGKVDDIRTQSLSGELKTNTRARGGFDEKIYDRLALQGGDLFDVALADGLELARRVEHAGDFLGREAFDI